MFSKNQEKEESHKVSFGYPELKDQVRFAQKRGEIDRESSKGSITLAESK